MEEQRTKKNHKLLKNKKVRGFGILHINTFLKDRVMGNIE